MALQGLLQDSEHAERVRRANENQAAQNGTATHSLYNAR